MKKVLYLIAAALVTVVACNKNTPDPKPDPTPDPTPTVPDLTLSTPKIVDVDGESSIYTVKFNAGKTWTATLSYPDGSESGAVLAKEKGEAADGVELKVTFQGLTEEQMGRLIQLDLKAGSTTESILFFQGLVFLPDNEEEVPTISVAGGKYNLNILTNMDVTIKKYDGAEEAFPWAPVTINQDEAAHKISLAFNVAANAGYDARTAYVKFTMPEIQVPVLDDDGNPTSETTDMVTRFYLAQEGYASSPWNINLPADFDVTNIETDEVIHNATASIALFNGKLLVCDATKVYAFDPATGAVSSVTIPESLPIQSITNDDAGNLLFAPLIPYGGVGKIYAVKATDTKMENPVLLIPFVNDAWNGSQGADKVAAKGDVFGNGVVTMVYGGVVSSGGLSYGLIWEISNGKAAVVDYNEYNKTTTLAKGWFTLPANSVDIWLSNRSAFAPAGPAVSDGFFYCGYDGLFGIYYHDGTNWTAILPEICNDNFAPNALAAIEWNGKKILACVVMAYFPEWGLSSTLYIVDVTNPTEPEVLSANEFQGEMAVSGGTEASTADVVLAVEGTDLVAYVVESNYGVIFKAKYPVL